MNWKTIVLMSVLFIVFVFGLVAFMHLLPSVWHEIILPMIHEVKAA